MGNVATSKTRKGIALTHRSLEVLKPAAVAYRVPDLRCPGLAVRVAPSGLKTWDAAFRIRGTNSVRRKSLGAFPAVGLDEARERANALIRAAQTGRDVIGEEAKAKAEADARLTVTGLIDVYIKRRAKGLRTKHEIELRLRRALAPLRNRYVEELRRRDIRALLDATVDRGAEREAEKRKQSIAAMFKWALAQDLVEDDPTRGLGTYSTGKLRDRILSADEIQVLWGWIGNADLTEDIADSLRLQLCTGYRVVDVVQGYIGFLKDEARRSSQSAAASAVQEARAEEIRLRTADKRREQETKGQAAAIEAIDTVAGPLKPDVLAILPRLVKDLALRRQLEDAIDGVFGAMSKRAATIADKLERRGTVQQKSRKARIAK